MLTDIAFLRSNHGHLYDAGIVERSARELNSFETWIFYDLQCAMDTLQQEDAKLQAHEKDQRLQNMLKELETQKHKRRKQLNLHPMLTKPLEQIYEVSRVFD